MPGLLIDRAQLALKLRGLLIDPLQELLIAGSSRDLLPMAHDLHFEFDALV